MEEEYFYITYQDANLQPKSEGVYTKEDAEEAKQELEEDWWLVDIEIKPARYNISNNVVVDRAEGKISYKNQTLYYEDWDTLEYIETDFKQHLTELSEEESFNRIQNIIF